MHHLSSQVICKHIVKPCTPFLIGFALEQLLLWRKQETSLCDRYLNEFHEKKLNLRCKLFGGEVFQTLEHFLWWPVWVAKTHHVSWDPVISAKVLDEYVYTTTLMLAGANGNLEQSNHSQVLLFVCFMLDLSNQFEAFAFINPFLGLNFCNKAQLPSSSHQCKLKKLLELFWACNDFFRYNIVVEVGGRWLFAFLVCIHTLLYIEGH